MHGLGNDYIYVNTMLYPIADPAKTAIEWSKPHTGIGSDGLILIGSSDKADFSMRIFNADGSEAMMCGNGIRCVGKYVFDYCLTDKTVITIDTLSGVKTVRLHVGDAFVEAATVDMGVPSGIMAVTLGKEYGFDEGIAVSMGNPHLVIFVNDISVVDVAAAGAKLEHHPLFPDRVNVEFAQVLSDGQIRMRVWERGSGITQACGTGACATGVAAAFTGRCSNKSEVIMDGGKLGINWMGPGKTLFMTGPATKVFDGVITYNENS